MCCQKTTYKMRSSSDYSNSQTYISYSNFEKYDWVTAKWAVEK